MDKQELLEIIKNKRENAQNDYERYRQKQNEYSQDMLVIRGEIMAYLDMECLVRNMEG